MRGAGLVHTALDQRELSSISSRAAIGHVRYSTAGGAGFSNAQPITANYARGAVAIAHNGNITNATGIRQYLENRGAIFQSTSDTETILHLMAHQSHKPPLDALVGALRLLRGAYSLAVLLGDRLVAARDPWGFRPLVIGRRGEVTYVASESCALDIVGAEIVRDVEPGEILPKKTPLCLRIRLFRSARQRHRRTIGLCRPKGPWLQPRKRRPVPEG
jgi:amidophosphoribosyltransferase